MAPKYSETVSISWYCSVVSGSIILITGLFLSWHYPPVFERACQTLVFIQTKVKLGSFIHSMHLFSTWIFGISLIVHLFSLLYFIPKKRALFTSSTLIALLVGCILVELATGFIMQGGPEQTEIMNKVLSGKKATDQLIPESKPGEMLFTRVYSLHCAGIGMVVCGILFFYSLLLKYLPSFEEKAKPKKTLISLSLLGIFLVIVAGTWILILAAKMQTVG